MNRILRLKSFNSKDLEIQEKQTCLKNKQGLGSDSYWVSGIQVLASFLAISIGTCIGGTEIASFEKPTVSAPA